VTTLTIDDELGRLVGEAAVARGKTLDEFAGETLRRAVCEVGAIHHGTRNGIRVMLVSDARATIDPKRIRQCLEEEGP
jgi:hypothetical protein